MLKEFTFDDWLNDQIFIKPNLNEVLGLDSEDVVSPKIMRDNEQFLQLVHEKKMSKETLVKIQDAKSKTYEMMLEYAFEKIKNQYDIQAKQTLDLKRKIELDKKYIDKIFSKNQIVYEAIIYSLKAGQIKEKANFITGEQFKDVVIDNKPSYHIPVYIKEIGGRITIVGRNISHEWSYFIVDVNLLYLNFLDDELKRIGTKRKVRKQSDTNIKLSDVLMPGITDEKVKNYYYNVFLEGKRQTQKSLTLFIKHLRNKGYYKRKLTDKELQEILKNDFGKNYEMNRHENPPDKNEKPYTSPPYSKIPDANE